MTSITRLMHQKLLKEDYISFNMDSNYRVVIKSCKTLSTPQIALIITAIDKTGYTSKKQLPDVAFNISMALLKTDLNNVVISAQEFMEKSKRRLVIQIAEN